jgi:hypothetical protein
VTAPVADAHAHVQRLVSVAKIAIMLEQCTAEEQCFVVRILWAKGLNVKNIHKEMPPVYGGKFLSRKAVPSWVKIFSQGHSKVEDDAPPGAEVAGVTVRWLLCSWFRRTGKTIGQMYHCRWRICQEMKCFSQVRISHFVCLWHIYWHSFVFIKVIDLFIAKFVFLLLWP